MIVFVRVAWVALALLIAWPTVAAAQQEPLDFRTWTDDKGRQAEMAFAGFQGNQLRMKTRQGKEYLFTADRLDAQEVKLLLDRQIEQAITIKANGSAGDAVALLQTVAAFDPQYAPAQLWLGNLHAQEEAWTMAADSYKEYARLKPDDVEGAQGAARIYAKQDNKDLAKLWYQRALEIAPDDQKIRQELAALDEKAAPPDAPPDPNPPAATEPPAAIIPAAPPSTSDPRTAWQIFWSDGLVGLLAGRTVWWGRLIALALFTIGLFSGVVQYSSMYRRMLANGTFKTKEQAGCSALFGAIFGYGCMYIIYWGLPSGWDYAIMTPVVLIFSLLAMSGVVGQSNDVSITFKHS